MIGSKEYGTLGLLMLPLGLLANVSGIIVFGILIIKIVQGIWDKVSLIAGFPAGTVSGAPKIRAMEIIDELEVNRRSFYAGCIGYFSANGNMDHLCLRIEPFDADAIRAHLSSHGIAFGEIAARNGAEGRGPSIYIEDPQGNRVELKGPTSP